MREPRFCKTEQFSVEFKECHTSFNMMRQHYHDTFEIYLQLDGERYLFFDNEQYLLKRGSLFVMAPFVMHITRDTEKTYFKRYLLNVSTLALSSVMTESELDELFRDFHTCMVYLNDDELSTATMLFKQIHIYSKATSHNSKKLLQMSVALLIDFIRRCSKKRSTITLLENGTAKSPVYTALAYINSNYEKEITLDYISDYVHMSKSNFCLVFKKIVGETFIDYLNTLRVSQAHRLLSTTDMPLSDIAVNTGFSSVNYMTRTFKKFHGIAPSSFRKNKNI